MKKKIAVLVLAMFAFLAHTQATEARIGIGVMGGEPSGLTLKFNNFPVIGIGYSFLGLNNNDWLHLTVDYWILNPPIGGPFHWYLGIGASVKYPSSSVVGVGVRVPIGIQFMPTNWLEIFLEGAPGLRILPNINFDWQASLGIRFYIL